MESRFEHRVSKGSRFNQIYIPREMNSVFEVGDIVEVKLIKKKHAVFYSPNLGDIGDFKKKLINEIFSCLYDFKEANQIFIVGSFLTEKTDYRDIDILLVTRGKLEGIENKIYLSLVRKIQLKFHIIAILEDNFLNLIKICPLTRSMLYSYASNKKFIIPKERVFDIKHLEFLLMMPQDLLNIKTDSRVFYDNLRRLITIRRFIFGKSLDPREAVFEIRKKLGDFLYNQLKNNELVNEKMLDFTRKIIKKELILIRKWQKEKL